MTKSALLATGGIIVVAAVGLGAAFTIGTLAQGPSKADGCAHAGATRQLVIEQNRFSPATLTVARCDRIQITNRDDVRRDIALGQHDHHLSYPGFTETALEEGQNVSFVASIAGEYHVHDHFNDAVAGELIIR